MTEQISPFAKKIYDLLVQVPEGRVTTYKALANAANTAAYRAVGQVMNRNPFAPQVPCHRVVNASGELGGFATGSAKKIALLKKEGIVVKNGKIVNFSKILYNFDE